MDWNGTQSNQFYFMFVVAVFRTGRLYNSTCGALLSWIPLDTRRISVVDRFLLTHWFVRHALHSSVSPKVRPS